MAINEERGRRSKGPRTIDLGIAGRRAAVHSHIASIWDTEEDFSEAVGFVVAGLRGQDHCVLIGDTGDNEHTVAILRERGVDVERVVAERRLVVITRESTAEAMLRSVTAAFEAAVAAEAPLVRLFGNVGWGRDGETSDAELLVYEARLTEVAKGFPSVTLCLHQVHALTGLIARHGVLGTHPTLLENGEVVPNPLFLPLANIPGRLPAIASGVFEQQELQREVRREAEILQAIFDNIPVMISFRDPEGRLLLVNREWERTLGWTLEEAQHTNVLAAAYPDPEQFREALESIQRPEREWHDFRTRTREGRTIDTSWSRVALSDGTRLGFGQDISERKRTDEALRESEERYRTLFESGPLPKILFDPETLRIVAVNEPAIQHYGYSREEFLRMSILDYRPPEDVERIRAAVREPHPPRWHAGVWRHIRKDGTLIFVEVSLADVMIHGRKLRLANIFDVTERRLADERLKQSYGELKGLTERLRVVREEERTRIAREVHDEIGQALTALQMEVVWVERKLMGSGDRQTGLESKLRSMSKLIDTTLDAVQRIATELRPGVLDELGLEAAIEWYLKEFEQRTGIACRFGSRIDGTPIDPDCSTAVFRILQEALTNVARHSVATRVKIHLSLDAQELRLEIRDNGRGIPEDRIEDSASLGLVGMRERARALSGDVEIRGVSGLGTTVALTIPL